MMQKAYRLAWLVVLVALMLPGVAAAQGADGGRFAPDAEIRAAFKPVVRGVLPSVVELIADGEVRAMGTVVDASGYVLSKASELVGRESILAVLQDGRRFEAELVGVDGKNDLAMLKITAKGLRAVVLSEDEPALGRWVACVGQRLSPEAVGIVSSKPRVVEPPQLVLGVILRADPNGLRVMDLSEGFGAQEAGMLGGDVLTHVGGAKVFAVEQVIKRLQEQAVGDVVVVRGLREGRPIRFEVRLSELEPDPRSRGERMNRMGGAVSDRRRGFERVLQHDAEIRPELCGGPVVNLKGEVIGLNIARAGRIATYALPSSLLNEKLGALKGGELRPADERPAARPVIEVEAGPGEESQ